MGFVSSLSTYDGVAIFTGNGIIGVALILIGKQVEMMSHGWEIPKERSGEINYIDLAENITIFSSHFAACMWFFKHPRHYLVSSA